MDRPQSGAEFSQGDRIAAARPDGATVPEKAYSLNFIGCLPLLPTKFDFNYTE